MVPPQHELGVTRINFNFFLSWMHSLVKAIGFADEFNDVGMMSEAVQQSSRQAFVAEDLHPISELEIGSDD